MREMVVVLTIMYTCTMCERDGGSVNPRIDMNYAFSMSRRITTLLPKVGEMRVGEQGL